MRLTFRTFLEATGDAKFDQWLSGSVAKATSARDFGERLQGLLNKKDKLFNYQRELETWVSQRLHFARMIPNKMLGRFVQEIQPLINQYSENTNVLEILFFHISFKNINVPSDEDEVNLQDLAESFMHRHPEEIKDACVGWISALERIEKEADAKEWPTGKEWASVTKFSFEKFHAQEVVKRLNNWFAQRTNV